MTFKEGENGVMEYVREDGRVRTKMYDNDHMSTGSL